MFARRAAWLLMALAPGLGLAATQAVRPAGGAPPGVSVTPVEGPSWLKHLDLPLDETSLGRVGEWGPPAASSGKEGTPWGRSTLPEQANRPFALNGADLYRLMCQSCHRPNGTGVPPEIRSLLGPVQATAEGFLRKQMADRGLPVDGGMLRQLSQQARSSLHTRLQQGGEKMPPFGYLDPQEEDVVVAYLRDLAGVGTVSSTPRMILEPPARCGELLVKGTCHTCHDASPGETGGLLITEEDRAIPPLATVAAQRTADQVIRKVREGAVDTGPQAHRGRMPLFTYLTPEEIAAAYHYLLEYPPRQ